VKQSQSKENSTAVPVSNPAGFKIGRLRHCDSPAVRLVQRSIPGAGVCEILHIKRFLTFKEADQILVELERKNKEGLFQKDKHYKKTLNRKFLHEGQTNLNYNYTGNDHYATEWPEITKELVAKCDRFIPNANSCLWNCYELPDQKIKKHSDSEDSIREEKDGTKFARKIGTLSFGATREFVVEVEIRNRGSVGSELIVFEVEHGDLIVMGAQAQIVSTHQLLRGDPLSQPRYSATIRSLKTINEDYQLEQYISLAEIVKEEVVNRRIAFSEQTDLSISEQLRLQRVKFRERKVKEKKARKRKQKNRK
jgi:alkylated DNA repair dioxygenase AlkB